MQKAGRRNEKKNIPAKKKSNWSRMANVNKNRKEKLGSGEGLLSTPSPTPVCMCTPGVRLYEEYLDEYKIE